MCFCGERKWDIEEVDEGKFPRDWRDLCSVEAKLYFCGWFHGEHEVLEMKGKKNISLWTAESVERKSLISKGSPTPLHLLLGLISAVDAEHSLLP